MIYDETGDVLDNVIVPKRIVPVTHRIKRYSDNATSLSRINGLQQVDLVVQ